MATDQRFDWRNSWSKSPQQTWFQAPLISMSLAFVPHSNFKDLYSARMVRRIDGRAKGRAENRLFAPLYSFACTELLPSVMRPDGRSCLRPGNATVSFTDRQQKQKESQTARQRDVGGNRWVYLFMLGRPTSFWRKYCFMFYYYAPTPSAWIIANLRNKNSQDGFLRLNINHSG